MVEEKEPIEIERMRRWEEGRDGENGIEGGVEEGGGEAEGKGGGCDGYVWETCVAFLSC